jgi:hypothetical protein
VTAEDTHSRLSHWGWHPAVLLAELDCELPGRHNAWVGQHVVSSGLEQCIAGILLSFGDQPLHCRRDTCHWGAVADDGPGAGCGCSCGGGRGHMTARPPVSSLYPTITLSVLSAVTCTVGGIGGCAQHICFWCRGNKPSGIFRCFGHRVRDLHCTCRSCERVTRGQREYGR